MLGGRFVCCPLPRTRTRWKPFPFIASPAHGQCARTIIRPVYPRSKIMLCPPPPLVLCVAVCSGWQRRRESSDQRARAKWNPGVMPVFVTRWRGWLRSDWYLRCFFFVAWRQLGVIASHGMFTVPLRYSFVLVLRVLAWRYRLRLHPQMVPWVRRCWSVYGRKCNDRLGVHRYTPTVVTFPSIVVPR